MDQKTVSDLIIDEFYKNIKKEPLLKGISDDLLTLIKEKKISEASVRDLLRKDAK